MADGTTYAFSNPDLTLIITKTSDAINEMNQLNSVVLSHTDALVDANRSDSGQILQSHLSVWNQDFHTVVNNLNNLNEKAIGLRNVNISAGETSAGLAQRG